ncbi:MAG: fructosamine kinase family protein [Kouleothrix sp.]
MLSGWPRRTSITAGRRAARRGAGHATPCQRPGLRARRDNYIGATPDRTREATRWLAFFSGEQRLRVQAELARHNGRLPATRAARVEQLIGRLGEWIDDAQVRPALLPGDLWGGNVLVGPGGQPALIDPAACNGDREADLAFTRLFGGFARNILPGLCRGLAAAGRLAGSHPPLQPVPPV